ncbi:inorganic phosphate transporter [Aeromicrobium sp. 636]|uniref:Inorganic phosphate transporter n=2 Tax=Aeromicrobium TaxID=2040 RepID=A0A8I0K301_9ACTN|nr:inorganic phosphate transporter [Aeromicrobium senzhongii]MBC9227199.1 inorganic phosphate transporter [Aeromicrobium senzhongii]MCQ3999298.1 inorganic phosphate transporter [Aeromicrobium sp. 636]MTB88390.1 inorganic phosphate transporter [Aeromicrobium senzhongii]QNL95812.1 inorganic phosphate transporter [Aeromicrobium senzhongii]
MVITVVVIALVFDYTNGFHDAANAIATSVSTRALTPRVALAMAAVLNFVGAWLGVEVAKTIQGIIDIDGLNSVTDADRAHALTIVLAALVGAITWNLITWYFGIPSSSSHALIGGIVGAGLASSTVVHWDTIIDKVAIPMVLSPALGFMLAFGLMTALMWIFRRAMPSRINRGFRHAQTVSAAGMALGHGLQDAQKTMGIIVLALVAGGFHTGDDVPLWVIVAAASAIAAGTYSGGWRIMRTLGRRIIELDPPKGFAAEATAASVLYVMAIGLHAPVSTTHTITSAIMGAGATKRFSAVRWGVAKGIVVAWVVTMPAAALVAAVFYFVARPFLP